MLSPDRRGDPLRICCPRCHRNNVAAARRSFATLARQRSVTARLGKPMKRIFALAWIASLTMSVSVVAKGPTSRITIVDTVRGTSIEITDPTVLSRFKVWDGPGTYSRTSGQETEGMDGFIVDWRSGSLDSRPSDLNRYEVKFYVRHHSEPPEQLAYTVFYERDSSSGNGFVSCPARTTNSIDSTCFRFIVGGGSRVIGSVRTLSGKARSGDCCGLSS